MTLACPQVDIFLNTYVDSEYNSWGNKVKKVNILCIALCVVIMREIMMDEKEMKSRVLPKLSNG